MHVLLKTERREIAKRGLTREDEWGIRQRVNSFLHSFTCHQVTELESELNAYHYVRHRLIIGDEQIN